MTTSAREVRHAARRLRHAPWYAATAIGTVALTMTLATTVFAVVDGVLFKPLPYANPAELFEVSGGYSDRLRAENPRGASNRFGLAVSPLDARELQSSVSGVQVAVFGRLGSAPGVGQLGGWSPTAATIDAGFLDVLGVAPLFGGFTQADFETPADAVRPALLTYATWQNHLAGRTDVVGEFLDAPGSGIRYRVAGVLPRAFVFPTAGSAPHVLTPLMAAVEDPTIRNRNYGAVARVRADLPLADVQIRFNAVAEAAREMMPERRLNGGMGPWDVWALRPLDDTLAREASTFRLVFLSCIVLIAMGCLNVSGLAASRAADRRRDWVVRRALGASRLQLAAVVVTELVLLMGLGVILGVLLSTPVLSVALQLMPPNMGLLKEVAIDTRVLVFAATATSVAVALASLWPMREATRGVIAPTMANGGSRATPNRSVGRHLLIGTQVALGLVLTIAGTLIVGSLVRIWQSDIGYATDDLLIVDAAASGADSTTQRLAAMQLLEGIRGIPGVLAVGAADSRLLRSGHPGGAWRASTYGVSAGFFDAVPIEVIDGRLPTNDELRSQAMVAAITPSVAATYFPDGPALGRELREEGGERRPFTVVGIVSQAQWAAWGSHDTMGGQIYVPMARARRMSVVVRTGPAAASILTQVLDVAEAIPGVELSAAASASDLLAETVRAERFRSWLFGLFAWAALTIVGVGILGVVALATARRAREFAIRMALGAGRPSLVRLMVRDVVVPVSAGLAAGALLAGWSVASLRRYVYDTSPYDPWFWLAALSVILVVVAAGVLVPTARASRVNPALVLRNE